ncbi:MAG TPA: SH3 domain-containing protein, partial [Roseiflexaceae bacterium]|nr:SH3 domain-containing protein [Roseiflexaceae bacterium]
TKGNRMPRPLIIAFVACLLIAIGMLALGVFVPAPPRPVTIYAHDPTTGTAMAPIHVWRDLNNRSAGFVGVITDGMSVRLIRRVGDGVLIELPDGTRGWVNVTFIAELH